jgi:glutathione S-transferase
MMTYQLYYREGSGSMVTEAALCFVGAPYHLIAVNDRATQQSESFKSLNPAGKIPVLVLPDGQPLAETLAQILVLDERHPEAGLLPRAGADRAKALQWLSFMATTTYDADLRFYYPHRYTAATDEVSIEAVKLAADKQLSHDLDLIEAAMGSPFFFGDRLSIVDVYAAMMADWHPPGMERPRFKAHRAAILNNPAVSKAWLNHAYAV